MKKLSIVLSAVLLSILSSYGQSIAYINTEKILSQIPQYKTAQDQLSALSDKYRATIESDYSDIEKLYNDYQVIKSKLSDSQRQEYESQIISKEKAVKEKQKLYFGEDGLMAKRSEQLLAPVKTKVDEAVKLVADQAGYNLVLDENMMQGVVYHNGIKDITEDVIKIYGIKNNN